VQEQVVNEVDSFSFFSISLPPLPRLTHYCFRRGGCSSAVVKLEVVVHHGSSEFPLRPLVWHEQSHHVLVRWALADGQAGVGGVPVFKNVGVGVGVGL
jgi:hypothetical protein